MADDDILKQFLTNKCASEIIEMAKEGFITGQMATEWTIKHRRKVCKNEKSKTGVDYREYAPSDLIYYDDEHGEKYCFTWEELSKLKWSNIKTNPYSGKLFREGFLENAAGVKNPVPIGRQIDTVNFKNKGFCPVFRSKDPLIVYVTSKDAVNNIKHGEYIYAETSFDGYSLNHFGVEKSFWKVHLKVPLTNSSVIKLDNFVSAEKVTNSDVFGVSETEIPESQKVSITGDVKGYLQDYMSRQYKNISKYAITGIMNFKGIRPDHQITVYRGIGFYNEPIIDDWLYQAPEDVQEGFLKKTQTPVDFILATNDGKPLEIGQSLILKEKAQVESWTTNPCVAFGYAQTSGLGLVLEYTANPDEILMDGRYVKNITELYEYRQQEVILARKRKEVKIHMLIVEGDSSAKRSFDGKGKFSLAPFEDSKFINQRTKKVSLRFRKSNDSDSD